VADTDIGEPKTDERSLSDPPSTERAVAATASPWLRIGTSLQHRDFRYYWLGSLLTSSALWMQNISLGWYMYDLTNSATLLGLVGFARAIPMLIFSLIGGILADRMDRRLLLGSMQTGAAVVALVLAFFIYFERIDPWGLILLAFVSGTVLSFIFPTRQAMLSSLVSRSEMLNAVALNSATLNGSRIVGPWLAGQLIATVGTALSFFLQAGFFLIATVTSLLLRVPPQSTDAARSHSMWHNLIEGFQYIRRNDLIAALMILAAVPTVFGMPYMQLLPVFARDILQIGPTGLGLLMASSGAGAIVGSVAVASLGIRRQGVLLLLMSGIFGLLLAVFANLTWLPASLAVLALIGASSAVYMSINGSLLQILVPDQLRGRVISVYMLTWGLMPLGTLPAGWLAERYGAPFAVTLGGAVCVVVTVIVAVTRPVLRNLE
jgi:MFS family permease